MSTELYYFTGTGNSMAVAKDIAEKTDGRLVSISSVMDRDNIETDTEVLGIVFPAYYMRMPGIVEAFIGKLTGLQAKYIFAIVTAGGVAGGILDRFSEAISLRDGNLDAGFIVRMPDNYIHDAGAQPRFLQRRMFRTWRKRSDRIADYLLNRRSGHMDRFNPIMTLLFSRSIDRRYVVGELSPDIDRSFWGDNKCTGCGICARV